jgi:2-amino-4-hydroxy-6-hydroxymethyldihydropteridine diphosphokinase
VTTAYVGLGSNLADPSVQLQEAVEALVRLPSSRIQTVSSIYKSRAIGPGAQPDYLNAVVALETLLAPLPLLDALQEIERAQGRIRIERWAARTMDLDILLYGQQWIDTPRLQVPHPAMAKRNFVLYPLAQIAGPQLVLPNGRLLGTLLEKCARGDLVQTQGQLHHNTHSD